MGSVCPQASFFGAGILHHNSGRWHIRKKRQLVQEPQQRNRSQLVGSSPWGLLLGELSQKWHP